MDPMSMAGRSCPVEEGSLFSDMWLVSPLMPMVQTSINADQDTLAHLVWSGHCYEISCMASMAISMLLMCLARARQTVPHAFEIQASELTESWNSLMSRLLVQTPWIT